MHYFTACISPTPTLVDAKENQGNLAEKMLLLKEEKGKTPINAHFLPSRTGNSLPKNRNSLADGFPNKNDTTSHDSLGLNFRGARESLSNLNHINETDEHPDEASISVVGLPRVDLYHGSRQNSSVYQSVERYKRVGEVAVSKMARIRNARSADRSIFAEMEPTRMMVNNPLRSSGLEEPQARGMQVLKQVSGGERGLQLNSFHSGIGQSQLTSNSCLTSEQLSVVASIVATESVANKKANGKTDLARNHANNPIHLPFFQSSRPNSFHGLSSFRKGGSNLTEVCQTTSKKYRDEIGSIDNVISQVQEQITGFNISIADFKRQLTRLREKRQLYEDIVPIIEHRIKEIERIKAALYVQKSQSKEGTWSGLNWFNTSSFPADEYIFEEPEIIAMRTAYRLAEMGVFNQFSNQLSPRKPNLSNYVHVSPIEPAQLSSESEIQNLVQRIKSVKERLDRG